MLKEINGTKIWIEGTWAEVTYNGLHIFEGSVSEGMTHEELYKDLYSTVVFKIKGETVWTLDTLTEVYGERADIQRRLAKANNCNIEDVEIEIEYPSI